VIFFGNGAPARHKNNNKFTVFTPAKCGYFFSQKSVSAPHPENAGLVSMLLTNEEKYIADVLSWRAFEKRRYWEMHLRGLAVCRDLLCWARPPGAARHNEADRLAGMAPRRAKHRPRPGFLPLSLAPASHLNCLPNQI
jgi:hypothetical protein